MKKIYTLAIALLAVTAGSAQTVTLANFDFNGGTGFPISPVSTATNITASVNGNQTNAAYSGTATGSGAFIQNTTAGNALSMSNSSGNNTTYWTLSLSGSEINKYMAFKVYFQSEHSSTGATAITISYGTDGSTFTALSQTVAPGLNTTYTEATVDLSGATALNGASNIYIRFAASGASSTGTLRMDNLQVQASVSAFETNGSNITFNGRVGVGNNNPGYPLDVSGDARITGTLMVNGLTATSTSLSIANPTVFSSTIKSNSLSGTGSRLLLTDATGLISPLAAGTTSQVLYGNGSWAALPASTFTASGSNAYFSGGNLGIGNTNPQVPLDVTGNARIGGVLSASTLSVTGGASFDSLDAGQKLGFGSGQSGIGYIPASANRGGVIYTGIHLPPNILSQFACTILPNIGTNPTFSHGGMYQSYSASANNVGVLSMGYDGYNGSIDIAGQRAGGSPGLLLDWYCGNDVVICGNYGAGNGTGLGSNGNGGVVYMGFNVNMGAPYPQDNTIALNLKAHSTTAVNIQDPNNNRVFNIANNGSTLIGNTSNITYSATKMLNVIGDVCFANYATNGHPNDGFSGLEILGNNAVPSRRGISLEADPNGDFNFYINGQQGYGTNVVAAEFNWKNGGNTNSPVNLMTLNGSGQLILGASTTDANKPSSNSSYPSALLQVKGDVVVGTGSAANIYVTQNGWADFVFDKNYKLMPLNELEIFYKENHHLPSVPTTKDIQEKGNNLGQTDVVLLQKIEELTLYMVEQQKTLEKLSKYNSAMEEQMQILKKELEKIKSSK